MQGMSSVRLPSSMPSLEDGILVGPESLSKRIQNYCQEKKDKRKHKWETHRMTLDGMKESKKNSIINEVRKKEMLYMLECCIT